MAIPNETDYRSAKRSRIKVYFTVLLRIVFLIILIQAGWLLIRNLNLRTVVAKWGTIEKGYWTDALFLREETNLIASVSGVFEPQVVSGTRVPEGEFLAYIHSSGGPQVTREEALQLYRQQKRLLELTAEIDGLNLDLKRINAALLRSKTGSASRLGSVREQAMLNEEAAHLRVYQAEDRDEIKRLSAELNKNHPVRPEVFIAPDPGYCFFLHDDWEGKLTPERILQIIPDDFRRNYWVRPTKTRVVAGDIIAKIINPFRQLILIQPDTRRTGIPKIGQSWWIKTSAGLNKVVINQVWALTDGNTKSSLAVALDDIQLDRSLLPERRSRVFLVYRRVTGIIIPKRAVVQNGPETTVQVVKGDGFTKQPVKVLESDDANVIVSGLDFGTTIISR